MSTKYQSGKDVPTEVLAARLNELADVVAQKRDRIGDEFTMRIPAECDRDADLVMSEAAVRLEALQAECEELRKGAEATRKSVKLLNYLFARNIIAMQSAVIEWEKGKGAAAGMQWIWNTLFGPGQIPDEDETDAQAYFDREIEPLDAAMQETSHDS